MRLKGIRINEVSEEIYGQAMENAKTLMDGVVKDAKRRLQAGIKQIPPIVREGHFSKASVSFTPKTGKNKGTLVQFDTDKRWTGRHYDAIDTLVKTIRRVDRQGKSNIRVYAGNFKAYWAFMVERGTSRTAAIPFLRPAFENAKAVMIRVLKTGR